MFGPRNVQYVPKTPQMYSRRLLRIPYIRVQQTIGWLGERMGIRPVKLCTVSPLYTDDQS